MNPFKETSYNTFVQMGKYEYGSENTKWDHLFQYWNVQKSINNYFIDKLSLRKYICVRKSFNSS